MMKRYTERHTIDPIILKDIDDSNEWLMGRIEDEGAAEDDLVFEGDDLTWGDVSRASGAEELRVYTRAKATKTPTPKPNSRPSSSKHTHTLALIDEDEEMIYHRERKMKKKGSGRLMMGMILMTIFLI